jgi:hypothetical protein
MVVPQISFYVKIHWTDVYDVCPLKINLKQMFNMPFERRNAAPSPSHSHFWS